MVDLTKVTVAARIISLCHVCVKQFYNSHGLLCLFLEAARRANRRKSLQFVNPTICSLNAPMCHSSIGVGVDARASMAGTAARPTQAKRDAGRVRQKKSPPPGMPRSAANSQLVFHALIRLLLYAPGICSAVDDRIGEAVAEPEIGAASGALILHIGGRVTAALDERDMVPSI